MTQDYKRLFYGGQNGRQKWLKLKSGLKDRLETNLADSYNNFENCLQFLEASREDRLYRQFKIYNKLFCFFQFEIAIKDVDMNIKVIESVLNWNLIIYKFTKQRAF